MAGTIQRWTKQARVIIDIIYTSNVHLTAEEIYLRAREQLPNISLGTVYRNLDRFKAQGIIAEVLVGRSGTFAKHPDTNAHFECEKCHRLYCIPYDITLFDLSRKSGFQVSKCSLNMSGICRECEAKETRTR